jgi:DNA-binding helix-hairpin-helix protein with protein kinase domain
VVSERSVVRLPDADEFQVITDGQLYSTRSLHQHAESWIDEYDRLHINTEDARIVVDPR